MEPKKSREERCPSCQWDGQSKEAWKMCLECIEKYKQRHAHSCRLFKCAGEEKTLPISFGWRP